MENRLLQHAQPMLSRAYAPYSNFHVACCLRTATDHYYTGCNVENASYGLTLCAEANAIAHMIAAGEHNIREILILVDKIQPCPPCGACRQRIIEFAHTDTPIHLATLSSGIQHTFTLGELLPHTFQASHFQEK